MRYGFIGLGNLGAKLATNLVRAGFELRVFDLDASAVEHLVDGGAKPAESAAMAADGVDALITCLPLTGGLRPPHCLAMAVRCLP